MPPTELEHRNSRITNEEHAAAVLSRSIREDFFL